MLRGFFGNLIFAILARMLCRNHPNVSLIVGNNYCEFFPFHCLSLSQQSITHPRYSNHSKPCDMPDASMGNTAQNLDDDDDDDESDHSFVPNDSELESFSEESSEEEEEEEEEDNKVGGQKKEPDFTTPVTRKTSKGTSTKTNTASARRTRSRERVSFSVLTSDC